MRKDITQSDIWDKLVGKTADPRLRDIAYGRIPRSVLLRHLPHYIRVKDPDQFEFRYIGRGKSQSEIILLIETGHDVRVIKCGPHSEIQNEITQFNEKDPENALALRMHRSFRPDGHSSPVSFGDYLSISFSFVGDCRSVETLKAALANNDRSFTELIRVFKDLSRELARWQKPKAGPAMPFRRYVWHQQTPKLVLEELKSYSNRHPNVKVDGLVSILHGTFDDWFNKLQSAKSTQGITHGDLNYCNVLLGLTQNSTLSPFVIDYASAKQNQCSPALDWAKLERDIKLRSLCDAFKNNFRGFRDSVKLLNSHLEGPRSIEENNESHSGKCIGFVGQIRERYSALFPDTVSDIPWVEYLYYLLCWNLAHLANDEFKAFAVEGRLEIQDVIVESAIDTLAALDAEIRCCSQSTSVSKKTRGLNRKPQIVRIPFPLNRHLIGRDKVVRRVRAVLTSPRSKGIVTLHGLGGIGKTQVAVKYCQEYESDYDLICFISATNSDLLQFEVRGLLEKLSNAERNPKQRDLQTDIVELFSLLDKLGSWLLVFDDATDPNLMVRILPNKSTGHLIITSQNPNWLAVAEPIAIRSLGQADTIRFLVKRTGDSDRRSARSLARCLGGLPLALGQAASYIEQSAISLRRYSDLFDQNNEVILKLGSSAPDYSFTVATTWNICFEKIRQTSPAAADLLRICAFLAPEQIPLCLFTQHKPSLPDSFGSQQRELVLLDSIAQLRAYSLIDSSTDSLVVHRLVQMVVRHRSSQEERQKAFETALDFFTSRAAFRLFPELHPHLSALFGHVDHLAAAPIKAWLRLQRVEEYLLFFKDADLLCAIACSKIKRFEKASNLLQLMKAYVDAGIAAWHYVDLIHITQGMKYMLKAAEIGATLGRDPYKSRLRIIAMIYYADQSLGASGLPFETVREAYERLLALDRQSHGPLSPQVFEDLCLLTIFYQRRHKFAAAVRWAQEGIEFLDRAKARRRWGVIYSEAFRLFDEIKRSEGKDFTLSRLLGFLTPFVPLPVLEIFVKSLETGCF